jgi:hypothetical protein
MKETMVTILPEKTNVITTFLGSLVVTLVVEVYLATALLLSVPGWLSVLIAFLGGGASAVVLSKIIPTSQQNAMLGSLLIVGSVSELLLARMDFIDFFLVAKAPEVYDPGLKERGCFVFVFYAIVFLLLLPSAIVVVTTLFALLNRNRTTTRVVFPISLLVFTLVASFLVTGWVAHHRYRLPHPAHYDSVLQWQHNLHANDQVQLAGHELVIRCVDDTTTKPAKETPQHKCYLQATDAKHPEVIFQPMALPTTDAKEWSVGFDPVARFWVIKEKYNVKGSGTNVSQFEQHVFTYQGQVVQGPFYVGMRSRFGFHPTFWKAAFAMQAFGIIGLLFAWWHVRKVGRWKNWGADLMEVTISMNANNKSVLLVNLNGLTHCYQLPNYHEPGTYWLSLPSLNEHAKEPTTDELPFSLPPSGTMLYRERHHPSSSKQALAVYAWTVIPTMGLLWSAGILSWAHLVAR